MSSLFKPSLRDPANGAKQIRNDDKRRHKNSPAIAPVHIFYPLTLPLPPPRTLFNTAREMCKVISPVVKLQLLHIPPHDAIGRSAHVDDAIRLDLASQRLERVNLPPARPVFALRGGGSVTCGLARRLRRDRLKPRRPQSPQCLFFRLDRISPPQAEHSA